MQLSLRTQQILAHESGVTETADPLGGSYYVESLTDRLEAAALRYIEEIDRMGGAVAALKHGYQMREIHESAFKLQSEVEDNTRVIVGVNRYQAEEPPIGKLQTIDPDQTRRQVERVKRVRRERDEAPALAALGRLRDVAKGSANTVPVILECVEAYATVGEIADVLRGVFGEQQELAG